MSNSKENILILNSQNGDNDSFGELYKIYINKIYRFIYYKTQNKELAEDITSKTFLKALQKINSFQSQNASFQAWLYKIARNNVIDYYRSSKITTTNIDDAWDISNDSNLNDDFANQEKILQVKKYLQKLKPAQRDILILRIWEQLSYQEISDILNKSEASCKMQFSRTIRELRKNMPLHLFIIFIL